MAWPPPFTITPASRAARTALPRSTPAIERPEPLAKPVFGLLGENKARQLEAFLEPRRGQPDDAGMPALAGHHDHRTALLLAQRGFGLDHGCIDDAHFDRLALAVEVLEFLGQLIGASPLSLRGEKFKRQRPHGRCGPPH